jgi:hypothetical protein
MTSLKETFRTVAILFLCMVCLAALIVFVFKASPWCHYRPPIRRQNRVAIEPMPVIEINIIPLLTQSPITQSPITQLTQDVDYIVARVVRKEETKDEYANIEDEFVSVAVEV